MQDRSDRNIPGVDARHPRPADGTASARGDVVRDCHVYAHYPNVLIDSVRNMRCQRGGPRHAPLPGADHERFTTPGGFRCRQVSGVPEGGQWRCVRARKAYRFEFGD